MVGYKDKTEKTNLRNLNNLKETRMGRLTRWTGELSHRVVQDLLSITCDWLSSATIRQRIKQYFNYGSVAFEQITHRGAAARYTGKTNSGVPQALLSYKHREDESVRDNENNKKQRDWDSLLRMIMFKGKRMKESTMKEKIQTKAQASGVMLEKPTRDSQERTVNSVHETAGTGNSHHFIIIRSL